MTVRIKWSGLFYSVLPLFRPGSFCRKGWWHWATDRNRFFSTDWGFAWKPVGKWNQHLKLEFLKMCRTGNELDVWNSMPEASRKILRMSELAPIWNVWSLRPDSAKALYLSISSFWFNITYSQFLQLYLHNGWLVPLLVNHWLLLER